MALDDEGNLYVSGWTNGALPGQSRNGVNDAYVLRMSSMLATALVTADVPGRIWTRQFGTQANDLAGDAWVDSAGNLMAGVETLTASTDATVPTFVTNYPAVSNRTASSF